MADDFSDTTLFAFGVGDDNSPLNRPDCLTMIESGHPANCKYVKGSERYMDLFYKDIQKGGGPQQ